MPPTSSTDLCVDCSAVGLFFCAHSLCLSYVTSYPSPCSGPILSPRGMGGWGWDPGGDHIPVCTRAFPHINSRDLKRVSIGRIGDVPSLRPIVLLKTLSNRS